MAHQAQRSSCAEKLTQSIRQLRRYLDSNAQQVERTLRDKMKRVQEDQDNLTNAHHAYATKVKTSVEDPTMRDYINPKIDLAVDILDEAELAIDKLKVTEDVKHERHEYDVSIAAIESLINDIQQRITNEDAVEADAIYAETVMRDLVESDTRLTKLSQRMRDLVETEDEKTAIDTQEAKLHESVKDCRAKGNMYVAIIRSKALTSKSEKSSDEPTKSSSHGSHWRMERTKFPTFSGNPRDFASFKGDFEAIVVPEYPNKLHRVYTLKENCLKGDAKKLVKNMTDYDAMWERLTDRFGDNMQIVDTIIKEISSTSIKEEIDESFIHFVDVLERGVQDLKAIGEEKEIGGAYTIEIIQQKLPRRIHLKWLEEVKGEDSASRFECLLEFLKHERKSLEKIVNQKKELKDENPKKEKKREKEYTNYGSKDGDGQNKNKCLIHPQASHLTRKCNAFKAKSVNERAQIVKDLEACPLCLSITHKGNPCPFEATWNPCGESGCAAYHSKLLHGHTIVGVVNHAHLVNSINNSCRSLLLLQQVSSTRGDIFIFWDSGSTISLVSNGYVKKHRLSGIKVSYDLVTLGNVLTHQDTMLYEVTITDKRGVQHSINAYGIDEICQQTEDVDAKRIAALFNQVDPSEISRPKKKIDLLIGQNHAPLHPTRRDYHNNLVLYSSEFGTGKLVGGEHELVKGADQMNSFAQIVAKASIQNIRAVKPGVDFFTAEGFGVNVPPKCNRCMRCKECKFLTLQLSIKEQQAAAVIRKNLVLNPETCQWETSYPYIIDPEVLNKDGKDNRHLAMKLLVRLENRLEKNPDLAEKYKEQFNDSIERGVFREVSKKELAEYQGPKWYLDHHEVYKEGSTSTPVRMVLNTSLRHNNISLNEITMKGPNSLNNLFAVQLNFRVHLVALVGDIRKMYQSIKTTEKERFLRLLLWRDMRRDEDARTYGSETVNFGDKSAACIAATALKETAELFQHIDEEAARKIIEEMYVDDLSTGDTTVERVEVLKSNIQRILAKGGFSVKGFVMSGDTSEEVLSLLGSGDEGRVLGVGWDPRDDTFTVRVKINLSKKVKGLRKEKDLDYAGIDNLLNVKLNKAMCLSVTQSCYDPYGLLAAITVQLKIELRELYRNKNLKWEDDIPQVNKIVWRSILKLLKDCEKVKFKRCINNEEAIGLPQLVMFADASTSAMCTVAYIRWKLSDGEFDVHLVGAKTRVTPLERMTIPKAELQASVMAVRLCKFVTENVHLEFDQPVYISDSKCTLATFHKEAPALNEFTGNRVAEALASSEKSWWYHVKSADNIADLGTRMNATVSDIDEDSDWQRGPPWLRKSVEEWPMSQEVSEEDVPKEALLVKRVYFVMEARDLLIDLEKMKSYSYLLRVTARIIRCFQMKSLVNSWLTIASLQKSEEYWLHHSMTYTREAFDKGDLKSLRATVDEKGIIQLSSRAMKGFKLTYNKDRFPILMPKDPLAKLWMQEVHCEEHSGITKTLAKSRRKFWIVRGRRLAEKVRKSCYECRLLDKQMAEQQMSPLPDFRLAVAPVFNVTSIDLFGPLTIRDTVKKRTQMKVWGFIATCATTRAVYLDITESYGTDSILQTIRRFIAIRGSPSQIISDEGSQLKAASKETSVLTKDWDWSRISTWAVAQKIDWKFVPAEGQHQNGLSESLIKSAKRSLLHTVGQNVLTFSELQLMFFEVANVMNSRPIGAMAGTDPDCPSPLTPNDLLLGRSTNEVACGPFETKPSLTRRFLFVQELIDSWWQRWYESVLPSLTPSYKWLQRHRNVRVNDICLIRYKSKVRSSYRLGRVTEVHPSEDGLVRKVSLQYKLPTEKNFRTVNRAVQGIAVIVPAEEQPE